MEALIWCVHKAGVRIVTLCSERQAVIYCQFSIYYATLAPESGCGGKVSASFVLPAPSWHKLSRANFLCPSAYKFDRLEVHEYVCALRQKW